MSSSDDIQDIRTACEKLAPQNLQYVLAVLNALRYTETVSDPPTEAKNNDKLHIPTHNK